MDAGYWFDYITILNIYIKKKKKSVEYHNRRNNYIELHAVEEKPCMRSIPMHNFSSVAYKSHSWEKVRSEINVLIFLRIKNLSRTVKLFIGP